MIKKIQVVKESVPTTGGKSFAITTIDPAKAVVMINGNSFISNTVQRFWGNEDDATEVIKALSPNVDTAITEVKVYGSGGYMVLVDGDGTGKWADFVLTLLTSSEVRIRMQEIGSPGTYHYYIEVIEHKEAIITPVLVSVAANAVVVDWASEPSVAADVSITVVEYL